MLRKRLIASACLITPVLGILWLDVNLNLGVPGLWMIGTSIALCLMIGAELTTMIQVKTAGAIRPVVFAGIVLSHLAMIGPEIASQWTTHTASRWLLCSLAMVLTAITALAVELFAFSVGRRSLERCALTVFATIYSGWLLGFLSAIRVEHPSSVGVFAVFSVLFIIKMSDAGAYFVGKNMGRNKLAPVLSPGKTIEGLVGGVLASLIAAFVAFWVIKPWMCGGGRAVWWGVAGYAASITIVGVFGDLCESMIKREMGCKDSSGWLPGLGGIMDTADSVILAAPLAYVWWASGWL